MGNLTFTQVDSKTFVCKTKKFIFSLIKQRIGVGSMGDAWILRVRKPDETQGVSLGSYWVSTDGGYNSYESDSVDGKLWPGDYRNPDIVVIRIAAAERIKDLGYA
jgi:hypothetical protein